MRKIGEEEGKRGGCRHTIQPFVKKPARDSLNDRPRSTAPPINTHKARIITIRTAISQEKER